MNSNQLHPLFVRLLMLIMVIGIWSMTIAQPIPESYTNELPFSMPRIDVATFPDRSVNIADYGAIADGQTMNTKAFADAIQSCARGGGGRVIVPAGGEQELKNTGGKT